MFTFNRTKLKSELELIDPKLQLLFGLTIVERLIPNYKYNIKVTNNSEYDFVRKSLDEIWMLVVNGSTISDSHELIQKITNLLPEADSQGWTIVTSLILDSLTSLIELIQFTLDLDLEHILNVAQVSIDSAYMYSTKDINQNDFPGPQGLKDDMNSLLVQKELELQNVDLMQILKNKNDLNHMYKVMHEKWYHNEISLIGS